MQRSSIQMKIRRPSSNEPTRLELERQVRVSQPRATAPGDSPANHTCPHVSLLAPVVSVTFQKQW